MPLRIKKLNFEAEEIPYIEIPTIREDIDAKNIEPEACDATEVSGFYWYEIKVEPEPEK